MTFLPSPRANITVRIDGSSIRSGCECGLEGSSKGRRSFQSISLGEGSIAGALIANVDMLSASLLGSFSCDRMEYGDGDRSIRNPDPGALVTK
jgi:hypothetical protein